MDSRWILIPRATTASKNSIESLRKHYLKAIICGICCRGSGFLVKIKLKQVYARIACH